MADTSTNNSLRIPILQIQEISTKHRDLLGETLGRQGRLVSPGPLKRVLEGNLSWAWEAILVLRTYRTCL